MLLSAVSVLVVAQSSSEVPEGLMNNPVHYDERSEDMFAMTLDVSKFSSCSKRKTETCPLHYLHFVSLLDCRSEPRPPHCSGFAIILRHITIGRTPPDERSPRRRDLYLTTHNTQKRETSMPPAGFEPAIQGSEGPQTHALARAANRLGLINYITCDKICLL